MKNSIFVLMMFASQNSLAADECKLSLISQSSLQNPQSSNVELRELSKVANKILKESFDVLNQIDHATLGLISGIATKGLSLEDLKPLQWDKLNLVGHLIFQDTAFSSAPVRGAQLTFSEGQKSIRVVTGVHGEFSESFSKIVSYSRLRLFPYPIFEIKEKSVTTMKIPITIKVESKVCSGQTSLSEIPLQPFFIVASK
jgi:hypothetical protein